MSAAVSEGGAGTNSDLPWVMRVCRRGKPLGTALVVGDTLLLTCAHVVEQLAATDLRVLPARARDGVPVEEIREHPDAGVALLRVEKPLDVRAAHFGVGMTRECAPEVMRLGCLVHGYPKGTDEPWSGMPLDRSAVDIDFGPGGVESIKLRVTSCEGKSGGAVTCRLEDVDVCLGMVHDGGEKYAHTHAYGADRLVRFLESENVRGWCNGRACMTFTTRELGNELYDRAIRTIWGESTEGNFSRLGTCFAVGPRHVMTVRDVVQIGKRGAWVPTIHVVEGHVAPSLLGEQAIERVEDAGSIRAAVVWPPGPSHGTPEIVLLEIDEGDRPFEDFFAVDFDQRWPANAEATTEGFPHGEHRRRASRCTLGEIAGDASGFDNASKSWNGWSGSPLCSPRTRVVGVVSKDSRQRDAEFEIAAIASLSAIDRSDLRVILRVDDDQAFIAAIDKELGCLKQALRLSAEAKAASASDLLGLTLIDALAHVDRHARTCEQRADRGPLSHVALLLFAARCPHMSRVDPTDVPNVVRTSAQASLAQEGIASNKQKRMPHVERSGHLALRFDRQIKVGTTKDLTEPFNDSSLVSHLRGGLMKNDVAHPADINEELKWQQSQGSFYSVILRVGKDDVSRSIKEQFSALVFIEIAVQEDAPAEFGDWYPYLRNAIAKWPKPDEEETDEE